MDERAGKKLEDFLEECECSLVLCEVTHSDALAIEHFADAVLRDDFFFRKGHWLSLISDSRVQLLTVRLEQRGSGHLSEVLGIVVLYCDSTLHNLFLARWCRSHGLGSAIIEALSPTTIRAKTDMASGDPSGFYHRLGFTHEEARKGKRGQIRVLTRLPESTRAINLQRKKKDVRNPSDILPDAS